MINDNQRISYTIYQLKEGPEQHLLRFASLAELHGLPVDAKHYDKVYTAAIPETGSHNPSAIMEDLYAKFNLYRPDDFHGHSLSVSDVVVLKLNGQSQAYYTDSYGFVPLPGFLADNPLRNTEMALEDDYDMIDGMINNDKKQDTMTVHDTADEKVKPTQHKTHTKKTEMER